MVKLSTKMSEFEICDEVSEVHIKIERTHSLRADGSDAAEWTSCQVSFRLYAADEEGARERVAAIERSMGIMRVGAAVNVIESYMLKKTPDSWAQIVRDVE